MDEEESAKGTARQVARRQCWDIVLTFSYLGFIKHLSRKGKYLYLTRTSRSISCRFDETGGSVFSGAGLAYLYQETLSRMRLLGNCLVIQQRSHIMFEPWRWRPPVSFAAILWGISRRSKMTCRKSFETICVLDFRLLIMWGLQMKFISLNILQLTTNNIDLQRTVCLSSSRCPCCVLLALSWKNWKSK